MVHDYVAIWRRSFPYSVRASSFYTWIVGRVTFSPFEVLDVPFPRFAPHTNDARALLFWGVRAGLTAIAGTSGVTSSRQGMLRTVVLYTDPFSVARRPALADCLAVQLGVYASIVLGPRAVPRKELLSPAARRSCSRRWPALRASRWAFVMAPRCGHCSRYRALQLASRWSAALGFRRFSSRNSSSSAPTSRPHFVAAALSRSFGNVRAVLLGPALAPPTRSVCSLVRLVIELVPFSSRCARKPTAQASRLLFIALLLCSSRAC